MKRENHLLLAVISLLILLLLGTFWWGNRKIEQLESQQQVVAYQAEGQYQRSFGGLSDSISAMN